MVSFLFIASCGEFEYLLGDGPCTRQGASRENVNRRHEPNQQRFAANSGEAQHARLFVVFDSWQDNEKNAKIRRLSRRASLF